MKAITLKKLNKLDPTFKVDGRLKESNINKYCYISFILQGVPTDVYLSINSQKLILIKYKVGDNIIKELQDAEIFEVLNSKGERRLKLVVKQLTINLTLPFKIGDKIHLNSKRGTYEVLFHTNHNIVITCNKWKHEPRTAKRIVPIEDFKCLYNQKNLIKRS